MGDLGLLALVIFVVPGFIADGAYRALRGPKLAEGDARTLLRSLTWSVVGYAMGTAIFNSYGGLWAISNLLGGDHAPYITLRLVMESLAYLASSLALATLFALVPLARPVRKLYAKLLRRSYLPGGAWGEFIRNEDENKRKVGVKTAGGRIYWGYYLIASDLTESHGLVLEDPHIDWSDGAGMNLVPVKAVRYLYIPSDQIHEVWLSPTPKELGNDEEGKRISEGWRQRWQRWQRWQQWQVGRKRDAKVDSGEHSHQSGLPDAQLHDLDSGGGADNAGGADDTRPI